MLIIGGFGFDPYMLSFLQVVSSLSNNGSAMFIDINSYNASHTLDDIANAAVSYLPQKNIVIAYSMGGLVAINLALRYASCINKIVLINSTPKFLEDKKWEGIKIDDFNNLLQKIAMLKTQEFMLYFSHLAAFPKKLNLANKQLWNSNTIKNNLINLMHIIKNTDYRQVVKSIEDKILWINSENDILIPPTLPLKNKYILSSSSHLNINITELYNFLSGTICKETLH